MAIFWLAAVIIWMFLVLRSLGGRTALSIGTVVLYSLLGTLWGPFTLWIARWLVPNPIWYGILSLVLLWIPIAVVIFWRDGWRSLTVADAFVLGFAFGSGYDASLEMIGVLFREVARDGALNMLSLVPPSTLQGDFRGVDYAMYGFWLALPSLALVAGLRFLRSRVAAIALATLCLAFSAVERIGWMGIVDLGFSESTANFISSYRLNGRLFPWIALGALVVFSAIEAWWIERACPTRERIIELMRDWQAAVMSIADRDWRKFDGVNSLSRLRRQTQLLRAEAAHSPENPRLNGVLEASEKLLGLHPDPNNMPASNFPFHGTVPGLTALAILIAGLVLFFPFLPVSALNHLWGLVFEIPSPFIWAAVPLPASDSGPLLTSSGAILLVLAAWFYLISQVDSGEIRDANASIRRCGVFWIKGLCLSLFSLLFLSGFAPDGSYFSNSILNDLNLDFAGLGLEQLYTYIPLLMAVAMASTLSKASVVYLPQQRKQRETLYIRVATLMALLFSAKLMHVFGVDQRLTESLFTAAGGEWGSESARQWASWLSALGKIGFVLGGTFATRCLIVLSVKHHLLNTALERILTALSLRLPIRRRREA